MSKLQEFVNELNEILESVENLKKENEILSDTKVKLENEISTLKIENQKLKEENEQLKSQIPDEEVLKEIESIIDNLYTILNL